MRQKIAQLMPAQARNDGCEVVGIGLEQVFLERVDLVTDEAGECHLQTPGWFGGGRNVGD